MGWTVYERRPSNSVFSYVLVDFPFSKITSDHLNLCFPWSSSGEATANLEGSIY